LRMEILKIFKDEKLEDVVSVTSYPDGKESISCYTAYCSARNSRVFTAHYKMPKEAHRLIVIGKAIELLLIEIAKGEQLGIQGKGEN